mgnify:CR=1 FL=1
MLITSVVAVIKAADPTFINFLKLNSNPRAKSKKVVAIAVNSYVSIYYWMGVISFEGKGSDR